MRERAEDLELGNILRQVQVTVNDDLELSSLSDFPSLGATYRAWSETGQGGTPRAVDPLDLPPAALPYLMLVDLVDRRDAVIRLAGTAACDVYGKELKGTSVHDFFAEDDAMTVLHDLHRVADSGEPLLTRRSYVSINNKFWDYVRLLLPLAPDGSACTRILKVIEP